ncbi:MAG: hypothetical protein ACRYFK_16180 [Janthinobacterium lividum]
MYAYAYEFLPARNHNKVANLHLAYVALGNNATSQNEGIISACATCAITRNTQPAF